MAVTADWYAKGLKHIVSDVDWSSDTIKVSLHSSSYTPDQEADEFFDDTSNELSTANGYTAGGATLGTKSIAEASLAVALKAAATVWTPGSGETLTARYAVIRKDTGTAGTSPLLGWVDFGADVSATGDDFTITWNTTDGALNLAAEAEA